MDKQLARYSLKCLILWLGFVLAKDQWLSCHEGLNSLANTLDVRYLLCSWTFISMKSFQ